MVHKISLAISSAIYFIQDPLFTQSGPRIPKSADFVAGYFIFSTVCIFLYDNEILPSKFKFNFIGFLFLETIFTHFLIKLALQIFWLKLSEYLNEIYNGTGSDSSVQDAIHITFGVALFLDAVHLTGGARKLRAKGKSIYSKFKGTSVEQLQ